MTFEEWWNTEGGTRNDTAGGYFIAKLAWDARGHVASAPAPTAVPEKREPPTSPLDVPCREPWCLAEPGVHCNDMSGFRVPHARRVRLAARTSAGDFVRSATPGEETTK